jgi:hypothetical protein
MQISRSIILLTHLLVIVYKVLEATLLLTLHPCSFFSWHHIKNRMLYAFKFE